MSHKYKRHSNESVERIHEYIFNCGGIVSGSIISKALHMSISSANCNAREAIRRYGDIESVSGVGYRKKAEAIEKKANSILTATIVSDVKEA